MRSLAYIMRNRQCIIFCILSAHILLFTACAPSSSVSNNSYNEPARKICSPIDLSFDCAASSLYGLCKKSGINISYKDCVAILPRSEQGNSMLEVKRALQTVGFEVSAEKLSISQSGEINTPCVVLLFPPGTDTVGGRHSRAMGHYLVLWPVDSNKIEIIDYPRPVFVLSRDYWVRHLKTVGIRSFSALLCTRKRLYSE